MKKIVFVLLLLFLLVAPFLTVKPIKNYYKRYEEIARKYECYPIEKCVSDFNDDGKPDLITVVDEPNFQERFNYRLKIFVESSGEKKQILNVKYDPTDNTLRTHVAVLEEGGTKKLVIYDTINSQQFFFWDGETLSPSENLTVLEREIWNAMALEDDTGGFHQKIAIDLTLIPLFGLYYLVLFSSIGMCLYFRKKLKLHLS
jgi:hypothetical protein